MAIYAAPGTSFEATTTGAPTGLVGTIGVRIMDGLGATTTARSTAGIVETPASSGIYVATLVAPTVAGSYVLVWDTGVVSPTTTSAEELVVTSSAPAGAVPSGSDLTTLAAVRAYLQKPAADIAQDAVLQSIITRASYALMRWAGREFAPATTALTRSFVYRGGGLLDLAPYDLRSVSAVSVDSDLASPTTITAPNDYALRPLNGSGVYGSVWLKSLGVTDRAGISERAISITGNWGFASVPPDVEQACIITAALWARRDVQAFSATFVIDEGRLERPEAIPSAARGLLAPYRRVSIA